MIFKWLLNIVYYLFNKKEKNNDKRKRKYHNNCMMKLANNKKLVIMFSLIIACFGSVTAKDMSPSVAKQKREEFVSTAKKCEGAPYRYGSSGPSTFDCSGLIMYCATEATGISLPRSSRKQYDYCTKITKAELEKGDLVFFKTGGAWSVNHVGIYIGNDLFISALSSGPSTGVRVASLSKSYWVDSYAGAGRFLPSGVYKGSSKKKSSSSSGKSRYLDDNDDSSSSKKSYLDDNKSSSKKKKKSYLDDDSSSGGSYLDGSKGSRYLDDKKQKPKTKKEKKEHHYLDDDFYDDYDDSFNKKKR